MFPIFLALSILSANPQILHLRADSGVVLDANGRVSLWKDLSPRHTDFGTSNLGKPQRIFLTSFNDTADKRVYDTLASDSLVRPRLVQDGIGGLLAVEFDGGQVLVDTTSLPLDSGFTLFVVAQDSTPLGSAATLVDKGQGDFNTDLPDSSSGGINGNFNMGVAWVQDIAFTNSRTAAPTLYESSWNGSTGRIWTDGILRDTGNWTGSVTRAKSTWLGGVINPHGVLQNFLKGRITEVVAYADSLTDTDRLIEENALLARYGIQRSTASVRPAMAPSGFSVHFASGRIEVVASGNGRVYATSLNGRILGQADLVSGKAELPRFGGEVLLTVRNAPGSVQSRLLVDPSR